MLYYHICNSYYHKRKFDYLIKISYTIKGSSITLYRFHTTVKGSSITIYAIHITIKGSYLIKMFNIGIRSLMLSELFMICKSQTELFWIPYSLNNHYNKYQIKIKNNFFFLFLFFPCNY